MQHKQLTAFLTVLGLGVAGTIQYHSAQFLSGFDTFFGDRGDARGFVYFCEHWYQSLLGKASLVSPGIFYPTKGALAYSDLLLGYAIPFSFLRSIGFGMFSSVEIVVILLTFLTYCAAFMLLHKTLGLGLVSSCAGAMFFAFSSPKSFQLTHLQLQFVVLLPLIFALVITFARQVEEIGQKRATFLLSLVALCLNLQLATAFYYAWFFALWSSLFLVLALAFSGTRRFMVAICKKYWPALLASMAVFLLGFIPILLLYLPTIRVGTWYEYDFASQMIPEWRSLLSMGDGNYTWGWLLATVMPDPRSDTWGELMVGLGLIPSLTWIALAVATIWHLKPKRERIAGVVPSAGTLPQPGEVGMLFLGITILATSILYLIGFKYAGHSPWTFVYRFFPGAGAIRAVSRYVIFLTLPMSIAFAYSLNAGLEWARRHRHHQRTLTIAIILLGAVGVFEQFGVFKVSGTGFSKRTENAYLEATATRVPDDCAAFYIAAGTHADHSTAEYQYDAMLVSVLSGTPTLNASSSQFPPEWPLYFVKHPDYEANVKKWVELRKISGKVCRLEIGPQVEAFDPRTPSPVDESEFLVRQLYRDFTGNEPAPELSGPLSERIKDCSVLNEPCSRAQVALNLFLSTGFHERGFFILRMYEASLERLPSYEEFMDGMSRFRNYLNDEPREVARDKIISDFVRGAEFEQRYNGLSDEKYKDRLLETAQVSPAIDERGATREQLLLQVIESDELVRKLGNRSFVALHYYGYLRRAPDSAGLAQWVGSLARSGDSVQITSGFITSVEYRERFRH